MMQTLGSWKTQGVWSTISGSPSLPVRGSLGPAVELKSALACNWEIASSVISLGSHFVLRPVCFASEGRQTTLFRRTMVALSAIWARKTGDAVGTLSGGLRTEERYVCVCSSNSGEVSGKSLGRPRSSRCVSLTIRRSCWS